MTDHLATVIAARLVIAAIDGGATLEGIVTEAAVMRPDMTWPTTFLAPLSSITQPVDPQDASPDPDKSD